MTWKEILPGDAKPGDYININGIYTPIVEANQFRVSYEAAGAVSSIDVQVAIILGVRFAREIEDHPHGLVPDVDWTHIVLGDGRHAVRTIRGAFRGLNWILQDGRYEIRVNQKTIQEYADEHGFEVLWPRLEVEITEEMVERAAKAMCANSNDVPWDEETDGTTKAFYLGDARAALEAVLGGAQE